MQANSFFKPLMIGLLIFVLGCSNEEVIETQSPLPKYTFERGVFPPSPLGFVRIDETSYEMLKGGFEWRKGNMTSQTDSLSPTQAAEHFKAIEVKPNSEVYIEVEQKPKLSIYLWEEEKTKTIQLDENQMTLPEDEGRYIYEVRAAWENGEVSYIFVVEVQ